MDFNPIWLINLIFLFIILVASFVLYWIPARFGKKPLGRILGFSLFGLLMYPWISFAFEEELFSKSDALDNLQRHHMILKDDFSLSDYSSSGIKDYSESFILNISHRDRERIISEFKRSEFFKDSVNSSLIYSQMWDRYSTPSEVHRRFYETTHHWVYECFKSNRQGVKPEHVIIRISKESDTLKFSRILN